MDKLVALSRSLNEVGGMKERIAFVPWSYIRIICAVHREELILDEFRGKPVYRCCAGSCTLQISPSLYEKILNDVVLMQNKGELPVGTCWKRRSDSRYVELTLTACANGKQPEISVRVL